MMAVPLVLAGEAGVDGLAERHFPEPAQVGIAPAKADQHGLLCALGETIFIKVRFLSRIKLKYTVDRIFLF